MSSPLKNVGCPFLCYTETHYKDNMLPHQEGIFLSLPHISELRNLCIWYREQPLFQECGRDDVFFKARIWAWSPEESSNSVQFFVVVKMEMPTTGNLFPSLFVMIRLSVIRLHMVLNVCSFSLICRPVFLSLFFGGGGFSSAVVSINAPDMELTHSWS